MKKYLLILTGFLLSACATVTATQDSCMKAFKTFPEQTSCISDKIAANRGLRHNPLVQDYVRTAQNLAAQVKAGSITDDEARQRLTRKLNQIRAQDMAQQVQDSETQNSANSPFQSTFTDCGRDAAIPGCASY